MCLLLLWPHTARRTEVRAGGLPADLGVVLVADPIGAGTALLAATLVLAVTAYSWRYFDEPAGDRAGVFPALLLLFEAGMAGFALTGDLFDAFVFFELMSVAAYALTGYRIEDPRPLQGALTFGIVTSLAAYCSLQGIALLYARTGELGLARIGRQLDGRPRMSSSWWPSSSSSPRCWSRPPWSPSTSGCRTRTPWRRPPCAC